MKTLTETFNQMTVAKGELFSIELPSNASTGYTWDVQLTAGKASLVRQDFVSSAAPGSMVVGAGGTSVYIYKAEDAGLIEISADYKRPWGKSAPAKSQTFKISVE